MIPESELPLLLLNAVMIGALIVTCLHHLFSFLSYRELIISLIFSIWIGLSLVHHGIDFYYLYYQREEIQLPFTFVIEMVSSYVGCLVLLYTLNANDAGKYQKYLVPVLLLFVALFVAWPARQPAIFGIYKTISWIFRFYLVCRIFISPIPYKLIIIGGSVLYGFTILFFGTSPLSMSGDFPILSKSIVVVSYILSINLYSLYVSKLSYVANQKLMENEIVTRNLKELDHLKTKFFSNITHEFRTPLTLIQGPAQELMEKTTGSYERKLLGLIRTNSERLLRLINQLLDLAKLDARQMKLKQVPLNLQPFLSLVASQFSSLASSRQIDYQWIVSPGLPVVMTDREKLETILINLISNAVKFTPAGGKVQMEAKMENSHLIICVLDSGRGIPEAELPHIFDRFYQVPAAGATHTEGTGIGLALVKEYISLLNGSVDVKSSSGKGTSFNLRFPLITTDLPGVDIGSAADAESLASPSTGEASSEKALILLAEDNADIRSFIKGCLGADYDYCEADDGKKGLELARKQVPDLIVSDLMMPEMDGLEFCKAAKKDRLTDHIPFILLTAKASDESKLEGLQTGAEDYLVKPFNKAELVLKVQNLIARRKRVQERIKNQLLANGTTAPVVSQEEEFIVKARTFVETNMASETLSVEVLADEMALSREQFYRKMNALTGMPPSVFIRTLRLKRAAELLAANWGPVSQVAFEVGYANLSHFSKAFKEEFGTSPSEYKI